MTSRKKTHKFKMKPRRSDPLLKEVLRQFMKKVHPDLFGQVPELKDKNAEALQAMMGVIQEARNNDDGDFISNRTVQVEFYTRGKPSEDGVPNFVRVKGALRTTGNNCRHALAEGLSDLFGQVGLPTRFQWGTDYWDKKIFVRDTGDDSDEEDRA